MKSNDKAKGDDYFFMWTKSNVTLYGNGCLFDCKKISQQQV
jgi:hypothetical protein